MTYATFFGICCVKVLILGSAYTGSTKICHKAFLSFILNCLFQECITNITNFWIFFLYFFEISSCDNRFLSCFLIICKISSIIRSKTYGNITYAWNCWTIRRCITKLFKLVLNGHFRFIHFTFVLDLWQFPIRSFLPFPFRNQRWHMIPVLIVLFFHWWNVWPLSWS